MTTTTMRRAVAFTAAAAALAAGLTTATPTQAHAAISHDLVIKNSSSTKNLNVCKDWSGTANVRTNCPSTVRTLGPGENSKTEFGWADADGAGVPNGWALIRTDSTPDANMYTNCTGGYRYVKLVPSITDHNKSFKIVNTAIC